MTLIRCGDFGHEALFGLVVRGARLVCHVEHYLKHGERTELVNHCEDDRSEVCLAYSSLVVGITLLCLDVVVESDFV